MTGWTRAGEVLAVCATGQPETYLTWAYAVPLEGSPPRRLPFGPVFDLALEEAGTALLTGRMNDEPAYWKRYRGGTRGQAVDRPPTRTPCSPGCSRTSMASWPARCSSAGGCSSCPITRAPATSTPARWTAAGVTRHTDHDGMYARNPSTDGQRIVYHVAGRHLDPGRPGRAASRANSRSPWAPRPRPARPRLVSAKDHLGALDCDQTGQASVVEVRGTVHWLTHKDGPARALHVNPAARARLPRVLGDTGQVVWVTDAAGDDALEIASVMDEPETETVRLAEGLLGQRAQPGCFPGRGHGRGGRARRQAAGRRRGLRAGHRAGRVRRRRHRRAVLVAGLGLAGLVPAGHRSRCAGSGWRGSPTARSST